MDQQRWCIYLLGGVFTLLMGACAFTPGEPAAAVRSLVNLPLPTADAAVMTGPVVALVFPPTPTPPPIPTAGAAGEQLINRGEQRYAAHCVTCHQPDGAGQGAYPALSGNAFVTDQEPTQVIQTVLYGRGQMPAFQDTLSNQEIAAVISYIRKAWDNNASAVTVEQVRPVAAGG
ncbi:MAG: cytochrome c [Caldilineaceae bacterium]